MLFMVCWGGDLLARHRDEIATLHSEAPKGCSQSVVDLVGDTVDLEVQGPSPVPHDDVSPVSKSLYAFYVVDLVLRLLEVLHEDLRGDRLVVG